MSWSSFSHVKPLSHARVRDTRLGWCGLVGVAAAPGWHEHRNSVGLGAPVERSRIVGVSGGAGRDDLRLAIQRHRPGRAPVRQACEVRRVGRVSGRPLVGWAPPVVLAWAVRQRQGKTKYRLPVMMPRSAGCIDLPTPRPRIPIVHCWVWKWFAKIEWSPVARDKPSSQPCTSPNRWDGSLTTWHGSANCRYHTILADAESNASNGCG